MSRFNSSAQGMTQEPMTPEMKELRAHRNEWARIVTLPAESQTVIDEIRAYLKSGPDQHGWQPTSSRSGGGGGRQGGGAPSGGKNYQSGGGSYRATTGGGAGGGRSSYSTAPATASAPAKPYVNRFSKPGTVASVSASVSSVAPAPATQYKKKFSVQESPRLTLLRSQINPLLSKINNDNFDSVIPLLTNFLQCSDGDLEEFLHSFMKMFMDIIVRNEKSRDVYVRLIDTLRATFPYINEELDALYTNYTSIFNNVSETKIDDDDLDALDALNKAKEFRVGYSQFIAELMRSRIITEERFLAILETIISNMELAVRTPDSQTKLNEYNTCLIQMISIVGKVPSCPIMATVGSTFKARLTTLTVKTDEFVSLTPQTRFTLKKCIDECL